MKVAIFGLGYVGTVTAACLAARGHDVVGVDTDLAKVIGVAGGSSPVVEPSVDELVRSVASGSLTATSDPVTALTGAAIALVCVGTPPGLDDDVDLQSVSRAAAEIGAFLRTAEQHLVVMVRSTMPPGSVEQVVIPAIEHASGRRDGDGFSVVMCPEFLREGSGVADFFDPPFTIIGTRDERTASVALELFSFLDRPVHVVPIRTAEFLKYACNAFHATKVSFANEMGRICRAVDIDAREVMQLFCEDDHLNVSAAYLRPGFSFGGSCLPKDLDALLHVAWKHRVDAPLLSGVRSTNELAVQAAVRDVLATGMSRVTLLGLSFKPDTDDLRSSPYVELAERLLGKGIDLAIYDPLVRPERLVGGNLRYVQQRLPHLHRLLVDDVARSLVRSDVAVIGMADPEVERALAEHAPPHVLDLVGTLGPAVESLPGYRGAGW